MLGLKKKNKKIREGKSHLTPKVLCAEQCLQAGTRGLLSPSASGGHWAWPWERLGVPGGTYPKGRGLPWLDVELVSCWVTSHVLLRHV